MSNEEEKPKGPGILHFPYSVPSRRFQSILGACGRGARLSARLSASRLDDKITSRRQCADADRRSTLWPYSSFACVCVKCGAEVK